MPSLRDLESEGSRGSSLRTLSKIAEGMSDSNTSKMVCPYCRKIVNPKDFPIDDISVPTRHNCRGLRLERALGKDQAISILRAQRGKRWNDDMDRIQQDRHRKNRYMW